MKGTIIKRERHGFVDVTSLNIELQTEFHASHLEKVFAHKDGITHLLATSQIIKFRHYLEKW